MLPLPLRRNPIGFLKNWDSTFTQDEIVSAIFVACMSALLFNGLGLLWFVANVKLSQSSLSLVALCCLAAVTAGYCTIRFSPMIATVLGFILTIQLGRVLGTQSGYLVYSAGAGFPLIDAQLYAIDQWLGFDWLTMLRWFGHYPVLVQVTRIAYDQAATQGILALPILVLARQNIRLMNFLTATFLALIAAHIVSIFLPAIGAYGYLGLTVADHPQMVLSSEGHSAVQVMQLRTRAQFDLDTVTIMGLITFPSFHTIMAVQAAWAFWRIPALRWPVVMLNVLVWVGTLFHGSHHLIDTFAGAIVAAGSIYAACKFSEFAHRKMVRRRLRRVNRPNRPDAPRPNPDTGRVGSTTVGPGSPACRRAARHGRASEPLP